VELGKYSIGIGDRFAKQGKAQLLAIKKADDQGIRVTPVWNKSFREHQIVNSNPRSTREEADKAVKNLKWQHNYFVDADHVGLKNIDYFLAYSDFFTLDVADYIGKKTSRANIQNFINKNSRYVGNFKIAGIEKELSISENDLPPIAEKYLYAIEEAGKTYRHILKSKKKGTFVVEVSMDETERSQTPIELFFILSAVADEEIPAQTIAPKFSGRFNKGVDYVGDIKQFTNEFAQDVAVINFAIKEFNLPQSLKLSVHSGSDKFSIYEPMKKVLKKCDAGIHLKTAGTTWLEELIGLAESGGNGLAIAKTIYQKALLRFDELCQPYATVIDIDKKALPTSAAVEKWTGKTYADTLRHDQSQPRYNPHFRQLLHVAYKMAAEMGDRYLAALEQNKEIVAANVTKNIFERHIKKLFL